MRGHDDVIELLNEVLTMELTAINAYFLHYEMCHNWGYERMAQHLREESVDEMNHAEDLIERILHLEGLPNLQRLGNVNIGETVAEQLRISLDYERSGIKKLNEGIELCRSVGDNGTREILEELLEGSEKTEGWLEAQLNLIEQVGEANYLSTQILPEDDD